MRTGRLRAYSTYTENNPINFIDPWGELSILPPIGAPVPPRGGGGIDSPFPGPTTGGKSKDRAPSGLGIDGNYVADEAKDKAKGEEANKGQEKPKDQKSEEQGHRKKRPSTWNKHTKSHSSKKPSKAKQKLIDQGRWEWR